MTKTVVITDASDGIGRAAALALKADGHNVVVIGRSAEKTRSVAAELGDAEHHCCDFAKFDDVRRLAGVLLGRYPVIDVLCNNAGGIMGPQQKTADGYELTPHAH